MKFLIDAQLPPALCRWLANEGHIATHVSDIGMIEATDREIAEFATTHGWIVISKDEDFLLLRLPSRFTFIWLRCGNATDRALTEWFSSRWKNVLTLLESGETLIEIR
jgi:predicted nuclease of predicted toxin-antitoxin system